MVYDFVTLVQSY